MTNQDVLSSFFGASYEWHSQATSNLYCVYIIQSIDYPKQFYTGFSDYLTTRLVDHNKGKSVHTSKFKPWKIVYYCVFGNKKKALSFERYLKTASGIAFRNKRLI